MQTDNSWLVIWKEAITNLICSLAEMGICDGPMADACAAREELIRLSAETK